MHLFVDLAEALAAAHDAGVVHRDIKPSNLILCNLSPSIRILDFGISKLIERDDASNELTRENESMGTPKYMSPEQIQSVAKITSATDMYSLGITLFESIAGRTPYKPHVTPQDLLHAHLAETPTLLQHVVPSVPEALASIVARCLQKDPLLRPTAHEMANILRIIIEDAKREGYAFPMELTDPLAMAVTKTVVSL